MKTQGGHPKDGRFAFQAYDKENEVLIKNVGISYSSQTFLLPGGIEMAGKNLIVGLNDPKYIVLQGMEAADSKGNDIFEGNIIEVPLSNGIAVCVVRYSADYCGFVAEMFEYKQGEDRKIATGEKDNEIPLSKKFGQNPAETTVIGSIFDTKDYRKYIRYLSKP